MGNLLSGNVTLLFSTDPVVCADLAYPMDGSYTEQAVENILSDLDAQALWLYPAAMPRERNAGHKHILSNHVNP